MTFKAINNTIGPNRLVPMLLVFSIYPRMTKLDAPSPIVTQCANVVKKAIVEIYKLCVEQ